MNKKSKRQLNMRNKLIAAIAMLLVSSIMMVSSTYAWFTLSTAPEVQGITTTVGANGNLEIALSTPDGNVNDITSNVGDSILTSWLEKNLTWGNLLNMSDPAYELNKIALMPSQLMLASGKVNVSDSTLAYPVYGSDGRISALSSETLIGGKLVVSGEGETPATLTADFQTNGSFGVRAVGTASGLTENQRVYNSGMAALRSGTTQAASVASASLNANGNALADMMVAHALNERGGATDNGSYATYVPAIQSLVSALNSSVQHIDSALKGALLAVAATQETGDDLTNAQTAINAIENMGEVTSVAGIILPEGFSDIIEARNNIATKVGEATSALNTILGEDGVVAESESVGWTQIYGVVKYLMNTEGVTINDQTIGYVSQNYMNMISELIGGVELKLGDGSGVYYDIHAIASKVAAGTELSIDASGLVQGMGVVTGIAATIETTYTGATKLGSLQTTLGALPPASENTGEGTDTVTKLDVFYGYILDFVFRTNAAGSNLQLQTDATNRVYQDGGSENTMGGGSTVTFTIPEGVDANIVKGLVEGIRVVFFDPASGDVFGTAKVSSVFTEEVEQTTETGNTTISNMVGALELYEYSTTAEGAVTVTDNKPADDGTTAQINESIKLCALDQNVAKRVSVLVYLDGANVTNADIMADGTVTGILNLQFSSSAELVPMQNSDLMDGGSGT